MGFPIIVLTGLIGLVAFVFVGRMTGVFAGGQESRVTGQPISPLHEAERIVAYRYARREITRDEYTRMLAVLRR